MDKSRILEKRKKLLIYVKSLVPVSDEDSAKHFKHGLIQPEWIDKLFEATNNMSRAGCSCLYSWTQAMNPVGSAETTRLKELRNILIRKAASAETDEPKANPDASGSHGYFAYTRAQMEEFGTRTGWKANYIGDWNHPRKQKIIEFIAA